MAETIVITKICPMCKSGKPASAFYNNRYKRDGLSSNCKRCHKHPKILTPEERKAKRMWRFIDLSGRRFDRLIVLCICDQRTSRGRTFWNCVCDCGKTSIVDGGSLRSGARKSCGCLKNQRSAARMYVHGMAKTREYTIWSGAKKRCFNTNEPAYPNYGGRGITMCQEWAESFEQFFADMGPCPKAHSIDRIDNNGNYEPGNCRWATRIVQNRNTRSAVMLTHEGQTMSLRDWADRMNMNFDKLRYRYENHVEPLFGSARRLTSLERDEIWHAYSEAKETVRSLSVRFGVGRQTIYNSIRDHR